MNIRRVWGIGLVLVMSAMGHSAHAQQSYTSYMDQSGNKVLVGRIDEKVLANDSAFMWFYSGVNDYQPDMAWIKDIRAYRDSFQVVAFFGTWCPDSQILLPKLYRVLMAAGFPLNRIQLIAVDHQLHAGNGEARRYHLHATPTFIFLHHGRELGRIVEQVHGTMESDIVGLLNTM